MHYLSVSLQYSVKMRSDVREHCMPLYRTSARIEVLDCSCICQSGRTRVYVVGLRDSIAA